MLVAHAPCIVSDGHAIPPFAGCTVIVRKYVCVPIPHETEHSPPQLAGVNSDGYEENTARYSEYDPYVLQSLTTQSTGHAPGALHETCWVRVSGHGSPPLTACVMMYRNAFCVPPEPHVTEQSPFHVPVDRTVPYGDIAL